ncbi:MAG: insulinase family protein [Campylobacter sp.]|nr:insulinase family protein [Campylobacter sp.]
MKKILVFLTFFVCLFGEQIALKQDPSILSGELENGLKFYIKENKNPAKTANFFLIINSGSIDEAPNERGLAHFIEHMAFNGSKDFSKNELIKTLEKLGVSFGADLNAYTSYDETGYMLNIATKDENLKKAFKVYRNWIDGLSFDANELEKERGVILAEQRQGDDADYRLYIAQMKDLFANSVYYDKAPIGDTEVIKNTDTARIKGLYEKIYQPRFMSFVAVGDFDKKQIAGLVKANFASAKNTNEYQHPDKSIAFRSGLSVFNYDANETGSDFIRLNLMDKFSPTKTQNDIKSNLLNAIISQLIANLYEQKTANENSLIKMGFISSPVRDQQRAYAFNARVVNNDFEATFLDMLGVIKGIKEGGFSKADFEDVKKSFKTSFQARYELSKSKKSSDIIEDITTAISLGSVILSDEDSKNISLKILDEITLGDVKKEFDRIMSLDDKRVLVFSSRGFKLDKKGFLALKNKATPYTKHLQNQAIPSSLVDEKSIKDGKILSKIYDKKHKFYRYTLENNATVVLKPTDKKKNFVLFQAVSKGGTSNLKEPKHGGFATNLSNESGAGEFNNYQISKILNGKQLSYEKKINELSQGYYASATTTDIKSLFEAINLEFNSPRLDEKVWQRLKTKIADNLQKEKNLPEKKFAKEVVKFYYSENLRRKPLEISDLDGVKLDELKAIIKAKFTNPSDYNFVIVGDFEVEKIEPLIKKYLASLSPKNTHQSFVDDGVRAKFGQHKFQKNYQTTQRSDVSVNCINYNAKYSYKDTVLARALRSVLQTALREKIREDEGETYGFRVMLGLKKHAIEHSVLNISFTASPKSVDKILSQIKQIQNTIKKSGAISPVHLENFKKSTIITMKKYYDQPDFLVKNIASNLIFDTEIFDINEYEKIVKSITNDDIIRIANIFLDDKNEFISINSPKK